MSDTEDLENSPEDLLESPSRSTPMLMFDKVKRDDEEWYMLRLTPHEADYSVDDVILNILKPLADDVWFVAEEKSKKAVKHYHCVFLTYKDPREDIKVFLVSQFPGKWGKADGNKRYNLQQVENLEKAFTYTSKDGDYFLGSAINPEYIKYVNSKAFQKKDARLGRLVEARERFIRGEITTRQLFREVCEIMVSTSETNTLNPQVVRNFIIGALYRRDPEYAEELFDSLGL